VSFSLEKRACSKKDLESKRFLEISKLFVLMGFVDAFKRSFFVVKV